MDAEVIPTMQRRDPPLSSRSVFLFATLLAVMFVSNVVMVAAVEYPSYPNRSEPFTIQNANFNTRVSMVVNQSHAFITWDTLVATVTPSVYALQYRLVSKGSIQRNVALPFSMTGEISATTRPGWVNPSAGQWIIRSPSTLLWNDGNASWLVLMTLDKGIERQEGLFYFEQSIAASTFSEPVQVKDKFFSDPVGIQGNQLVRVNATHLAAVWEEGGAIKYRLTGDRGSTWGDETDLFNSSIVQASFVRSHDGGYALILRYSDDQNATVIPSMPYVVFTSGGIEQWPDLPRFALTNATGSTGGFVHVAHCRQDVFLWGQGMALRYTENNGTTIGRESVLYNVSIGGVSTIRGLHLVTDDLLLCFTSSTGNRLSYIFLPYTSTWDLGLPWLPPEVLFIIVVSVIIGVQLALFLFYKRIKQKRDLAALEGNGAGAAAPENQDAKESPEVAGGSAAGAAKL